MKYTDEPLDELKVVKDFLPRPKDLFLRDDNVKVSIALSRTSLDFFKRMARKHHTSYQKIIRRLVDAHSARYQKHR